MKDSLLLECPLQIYINFLPYSITMRTPNADNELITGLLYTERVIEEWNNEIHFEVIQIEKDIPLSIRLKIDPTKIKKSINDNRSLISSSSCGVCGKRHLDDIYIYDCNTKQKIDFEEKLIESLFEKMSAKQFLFNETGACHAAAAFTIDGRMLNIYEDVGRHNAVDKVIGGLVLDQTISEATTLVISGRVSYEIVFKAARAGFSVICAVSAPSSMAVETAAEQGISLYAFCRGNRFTKYS